MPTELPCQNTALTVHFIFLRFFSLAGIDGPRIGGQASLMTLHGSRNIVHSTVEYSIFYTATVRYLVSATVCLKISACVVRLKRVLYVPESHQIRE